MTLRQRKPRQHDDKHLDFIRGLPCCICLNNIETQAAHIRMADLSVAKPMTGMGEKPHDKYTVPLCGACHRLQHSMAEWAFWNDPHSDRTRDPIKLALALYSVSGDHAAGEQIIRAYH